MTAIAPKELLTATPGGLSLLVVSGGADGQVLTQQADGTYAPEAAAGGSPGGSSGQVQYNNAGAFGGMTAVVYAGTGTHVAITSQAAATIPLCVKGAASQSGDLTQWQNSSGTVLAKMDSAGVLTSSGANFSNNVTISGGSLLVSANVIYLGSYLIGLRSPGSGILEVNSGTPGAYRDLIVRNLRMSAPTLVPASASATGSEGQIAWDATYIYVCTATNTWKRVAIATW